MRRTLFNILAAFGVAVALSGCIIDPYHHGGGYGYVHGGGGGGGHYHNGY